ISLFDAKVAFLAYKSTRQGCRMAALKQHNFSLDSTAGGSTGRLRAPQHTADHIHCPACTETNLLLLQIDNDFSRLPFSSAAQLWMELRRHGHLKARTHESNDGYIEALGKFFESMRLCDITPGHIRAYQQARQINALEIDGRLTHPWMHNAGNSIINHECSALAQILKRGK